MNYSSIIKPDINTNLSEIEQIERMRLLGRAELPDPNVSYTIRAATYARVSTAPQATSDKASIPEQLQAARKVIEQNDWKFIKEYTDTKATSYEEEPEKRKGLSQALGDAKNGFYDVLIVWIDSRLGRNSDKTREIRKLFKDFGVQIYSIKKPLPITDPRFYNPKRDKFKQFIEGINDLYSEAESAEFAEKMQFGKLKKAIDGKIPCGVPYGYKKEKNVDREKDKFFTKTIPVKRELQVVSMIFDMYLNQGFGFRKIVESLNEKGYKTRKGKPWCYSSVRYVLKNPAYAGKVRWGWRLSDSKASRQRLMRGHTGIISKGEHKAIISEEDFVRVQKKIEARVKLGGRAVSSRGLLVGILKCGRCGGNAYVTSSPSAYAYQKGKEGKRKENYSRCYYYVCSTVSKYGGKACKRYIGAQKKIEGYVINQIKSLASSPEAQKAFQKEIRKTNTKHLKERIKSLKKELRRLPEMRNRCSIAYREGVMKLEDYGNNIAQLDGKQYKLETEIKERKKGIEQSKITEEKIKKALKAFRDFDLIWDKASFGKKKDLIRDIMKEVRATNRKIEIIFNTP